MPKADDCQVMAILTKKTAAKKSRAKAPAKRATKAKAAPKAAKPATAIKAKKSSAKASATKAKKSVPARSAPPLAQVDQDVLEFIAAIDQFKKTNSRPFPSWSEVLLIVRELGYRRN